MMAWYCRCLQTLFIFFFTRDVINDGIINAHFREKQNASFRLNDLFFRSMPLA